MVRIYFLSNPNSCFGADESSQPSFLATTRGFSGLGGMRTKSCTTLVVRPGVPRGTTRTRWRRSFVRWRRRGARAGPCGSFGRPVSALCLFWAGETCGCAGIWGTWHGFISVFGIAAALWIASVPYLPSATGHKKAPFLTIGNDSPPHYFDMRNGEASRD